MTVPLPCPDGELLTALMRGQMMSAEEVAELERHLILCTQCRSVADLILGDDEPLIPEGSPRESVPPVAFDDCVSPLAPDTSATPPADTAEPAKDGGLLIEAVQSGDEQAWQQLVAEYHGRLLAFARRQLGQDSDADDVVQDTFVGLLKSLGGYRGEAGLETWLFQILRRRIADHFRRQGVRREVTLVVDQEPASQVEPAAAGASPGESPSWYARREEQRAADHQVLAAAVADVTGQLKRRQKFRDLMVFDLLFFAGRKNGDIAARLDLEETAVAVLKHRLVRRVAGTVARFQGRESAESDIEPPSDALLVGVWEGTRPTCPKRSTLGKFLLRILTDDWDSYVRFHSEELGCRYCQANLADLQHELDSTDALAESARSRILESTVGFLPARRS